MAYVIMAIGALMCAAGLYFTATGSQIVQVEAGWTSVIAGSVLIAGGVVTMTLGLIMRILLRLQATAKSDAPAPKKTETQALPLHQDLPMPQPAAPEEPARPLEVALPETPAIPIAEPKYQMPPPLPYFVAVHPAPVEEPSKPAFAEDDPFLAEPLEAVDGHAEAHPAADAVHTADDYKIETPSTPEHDLPPVEPEEAPDRDAADTAKETAHDDWLDQALAAIDKEIPIQTPTHQSDLRSRETISADRTLPKATPLKLEPASTPVQPAKAGPKKPEPPQFAAAHTSAIIGRYEADGTSYIMYADGSIEAQSDAGVYRFASMAELKAHIES